MNIVVATQKPIQALNLIYLLGGMDVFPAAIIFVSTGDSHKKLGLMDESKESLSALKFQCQVLNIPFYSVENIQSQSSIALLLSMEIDLILSLVTSIILKDVFINTSKYGVVSSHGGLLPEYRGVDCLRWAILHGERYVGMSTQLIDSGVDTGAIISTSVINLVDMLPCTVSDLSRTIFYQKKLYTLLDPVRQLIKNGKIKTKDQSDSDGRQYFSMHQELSKIVNLVLSGNE
jgi:methionyl-tRNA formyltransferase